MQCPVTIKGVQYTAPIEVVVEIGNLRAQITQYEKGQEIAEAAERARLAAEAETKAVVEIQARRDNMRPFKASK